MKARYRTRQHKAAFRKKKAAKRARRVTRDKVLLANLLMIAKRLHDAGLTMSGRIGSNYTPGIRQARPLCSETTPTVPPANN